ncbi:MAG: quercetin 2,3-dioxygenase [Lysobacterales bacterium CG_4_9_14_3_um_filter_62_6]|nr:MAG: quercetin 2,3-dioxygenase [Xanthomonadales bacterium CG_4_9_14_3_um_filter_62_6]
MTPRSLQRVIPSLAVADGAGVKLRRSLGASQGLRHDPFLLLDEFFSDDPNDYLAGFPAHPHRGFETVTYMLDGHMQHHDHLGNTGDLGPGDVQWMTAAGGIIHSEMPQQTNGRLRGFQLWINLPAAEKMQPPAYRDLPARDLPMVGLLGGGEARVIAGVLTQGEQTTAGPIQGHSTAPLYLDLHLPAGSVFEASISAGHNAFVYVYDGDANVGAEQTPLPLRAACLLSDGDQVRVGAGDHGARLLLLAAKPLHEPVVQYGPFVMNTREQIEQAISDYQNGTLAQPG